METYQFFLDLSNQGKPYKFFSRIVTCNDPKEDGLDRFVDDINNDGRYLAIEDDISYQQLK